MFPDDSTNKNKPTNRELPTTLDTKQIRKRLIMNIVSSDRSYRSCLIRVMKLSELYESLFIFSLSNYVYNECVGDINKTKYRRSEATLVENTIKQVSHQIEHDINRCQPEVCAVAWLSTDGWRWESYTIPAKYIDLRRQLPKDLGYGLVVFNYQAISLMCLVLAKINPSCSLTLQRYLSRVNQSDLDRMHQLCINKILSHNRPLSQERMMEFLRQRDELWSYFTNALRNEGPPYKDGRHY